MASVTINSLPVATLLTPNDAAGRLAKMVYTAGSGWASPRMEVSWSYSDAEAQAQTQYELEIAVSTTPTASGGSPSTTIVSGAVASAATSATPTPSSAYIEGNYYHVRVRVYDGLEWSAWSGWFACRVRWGLSTHRKDVRIGGSPPTSWAVTGLNSIETGTSDIVLEYNSSTDGTGGLLAWKSDLSAVAKNNWVHYRAWFFAWGTSPVAVRPQLQLLEITASGLSVTPDFWEPSPISGELGSIAIGYFAFGSQSLQMTGDNSTNLIRQEVRIEPNTDYILQARIASVGNSGARISLAETAGGVALVESDPLTADSDFVLQTLAPWNSGTRSSIWVQCRINGAGTTGAFFDGVKIEKGRVASSWTPTYVGVVPAVGGIASVVDGGGVQVDASRRGVFRLKGSTGGTRDVVELGARGLKIGGTTSPVELWSPSAAVLQFEPATAGLAWGPGSYATYDTDLYRAAAGVLATNNSLAIGKFLKFGSGTFPASPAVNDLYYSTSSQSLWFWTGTRWLSTVAFHSAAVMPLVVLPPYSANQSMQMPVPWTGFQDLWLETFQATFYVAGGTALSASHKWVMTAVKQPAGVLAATVNIDSGGSSAWRTSGHITIGQLMGLTNFAFDLTITKTGTPGVLYILPSLTYRLVG